MRRSARLAGGAICLLVSLPWLAGAGPVAEWRLNDPADISMGEYVELNVEGESPLWLVVELDGPDLAGEEGRGAGIGLWHEAEEDGGLAEVRIEQRGGETVIRGVGHGRGTDVERERRLLHPRAEKLGLALHYDPAAHVYEVFVREGDEAWKWLGTGATRDERRGRFVRAEGLTGGRMYVTQESVAGVERAPEDPPFVTATAWAVADGRTGEIVAGHEAESPRKNASITKAMCALVVIRLSEEDPAVLDEMITFSELAANTSGSSARMEEGERVKVRDALYGLMLPSGNDMGNAIAEHFHDRLDPPGDPDSVPESRATRANFVAEMNRVAAEIGMTNTIYRIPFGDGGTADDHTTTAADLMLLARAAFGHPLFRQVVGTQEHTAAVTTPDGGMREATWRNTNQLLGRKGFDGIKTGTTRTAGSCLLSTAFRGEDRLLMVVLGSSYPSRRYIDSEALYAWAWDQRRPRR
jgi:serine-type D-Ala-D-Ala carboxypeptidase (penicillin-binding protein 5/6)